MNTVIALLEASLAFVRRHGWWLLGAGCASLLGLLCLGAPGMVALAAFDLVWTTPASWSEPHGDTVWPTAIVLSLVAPWLVFGARLALLQLGSWPQHWRLTLLSLLGALPPLAVLLVLYKFTNR